MVIKVRKQSIYSEPQLKGTYIISVEKIQIEKCQNLNLDFYA